MKLLLTFSTALLGLAIAAVPPTTVPVKPTTISINPTTTVQPDVMVSVDTTTIAHVDGVTVSGSGNIGRGHVKPTTENPCDLMCTKFEFDPVCATNGQCMHDFANQCIMDIYNCKHPKNKFVKAAKKDMCQGHSMRRCKQDELHT